MIFDTSKLESITVLLEFVFVKSLTINFETPFLLQGVRARPPAGALARGFVSFNIDKWEYGGLPLFWLDQWFDMGPNYLLVSLASTRTPHMTNDVLITDELVERVARVICTNAESAMVTNGGGWRSYIDATRAALAVVVPEIVERCEAVR